MPRAQQWSPESLQSRIRLWLLDHPGAHRPSEVAAGLGVPPDFVPEDGKRPPKSRWTIMVARELGRMCDRFGTVERVPGEVMTRGNVPASTYRLPQP